MKEDDGTDKRKYKIEHLGEISKDEIIKQGKTFKINIIGDLDVGKTSISIRAIKGQFRGVNYNPTVNLDIFYCALKINDKIFNLMFWDTCGQERFCSLTPNLFKGTQIVWIVYAINDRKSFENVGKWVNIARNQCNDPSIIVILVGNKCDLEEERKVSKEEGEEMKLKYNFSYFSEVSSKNGINIVELVDKMGTDLYEKFVNKDEISNKNVKLKKEDLTKNKQSSKGNNKNKKKKFC